MWRPTSSASLSTKGLAAKEIMAKKDIHVVPHNGAWATRKEGAQRVGHTADTQREAY